MSQARSQRSLAVSQVVRRRWRPDALGQPVRGPVKSLDVMIKTRPFITEWNACVSTVDLGQPVDQISTKISRKRKPCLNLRTGRLGLDFDGVKLMELNNWAGFNGYRK